MYLLTKIIGLILFSFGLVLLMACFDSINTPLLDTILLGFAGLIFAIVGVLCLIWHEPYDNPTDK